MGERWRAAGRAVPRILAVWLAGSLTLAVLGAVLPGLTLRPDGSGPSACAWAAAAGAGAFGLLNALVWPLPVRALLLVPAYVLGLLAFVLNGLPLWVALDARPFVPDGAATWHGQSPGEPFADRFGVWLRDLVRSHCGLPAGPAPAEAGAEERESRAAARAALRRPERGAGRRPGVEPVVLGSGNLGLVSFPDLPGRATRQRIEERTPGLLAALADHPGIGFVLVRDAERGPLVLGAGGAECEPATGTVRGGADPLAPFGPRAAAAVLRTDGFEHAADIMVNSVCDPASGEVHAFEDQIGSHGGLGGPRSRPFLLHPRELPFPKGELTGAEAVHAVLREWMGPADHEDATGTPGPRTGAQPVPDRTPRQPAVAGPGVRRGRGSRRAAGRTSRPGRPPSAASRPPAVRQPLQVGAAGVPLAQRLPGQRRIAHPVRPHAAPVGAARRVGVAPDARGRGDVGEPGGPGPGGEPPAGVRLAAVGARAPLVERHPLVQFGQRRVPGEAVVVAVAGRHDPARPAHPAHLAQRRHRVGDVLEHLVGVHHVEPSVGQAEPVHVGDDELHVVQAAFGHLPGGGPEHVRGGVAGGDPAAVRRDQRSQVGGDGARTAADVQQPHPRPQVLQQVAGGVARGAPAVRTQDGFVVAVGVDGHGRLPSVRWPARPHDSRRPSRWSGNTSACRTTRAAGARRTPTPPQPVVGR